MTEQPLLTAPGAGVHQRGVAFEMDQINGGVFGSSQALATDLKDFAGDGDRLRHKGSVLMVRLA